MRHARWRKQSNACSRSRTDGLKTSLPRTNQIGRAHSFRRHRHEEGAVLIWSWTRARVKPRIPSRTRFSRSQSRTRTTSRSSRGDSTAAARACSRFAVTTNTSSSFRAVTRAARREPDDATKDLWGFTLVRRQKPAAGTKIVDVCVSRSRRIDSDIPRAYRSCVAWHRAKTNPRRPMRAHSPYGTCIKLYNYRWKKKTLVTTDGRYELERYLHSVPLPLRISETREYKANYYSTTLSGILAHVSEEGGRTNPPRSSRRASVPPMAN